MDCSQVQTEKTKTLSGDIRTGLTTSNVNKQQQTTKTFNIFDQNNPMRVTYHPYIQGQAEPIKRILSLLGIQIVFRLLKTLKKILSKPEHETPILLKSIVVTGLTMSPLTSNRLIRTSH